MTEARGIDLGGAADGLQPRELVDRGSLTAPGIGGVVLVDD